MLGQSAAHLFGHLFVVSLFLLCFHFEKSQSRRYNSRNFVVTTTLPDGEVETIVHYRGVTAKELTAVTVENTTEASAHPAHGYILWQVTDGRHFVQLIHNSDMKIWDCDYVTDDDSVKKFLQETRDHTKNSDRTILSRLTPALKKLTNYRSHRRQCKQLHKQLKKQAKQKRKMERMKSKGRVKRGVFIYPGTNFCGVGSSENNRTMTRSDRCCRDHDHCPYTVVGWSTKFNLFNYRYHTLSHCHCDDRFRACLKQINSRTSNIIGYLYFNVVKIKCFVFKKEEVCARRSWWGTCTKYENSVSAKLNDPTDF